MEESKASETDDLEARLAALNNSPQAMSKQSAIIKELEEEVKAPEEAKVVQEAKAVEEAKTQSAQVIAPLKPLVPIPVGKPSFNIVISVQHTSGYWGADKAPYLAGCFKDRQTEDEAVR